MSKIIQIWDVATVEGPTRPISNNAWRARLTLNYLGIDSTTNWVHLSDVKSTAMELDVAPVEKTPLGEDLYTCPFIYDPKTQRSVMDSYFIARYLEQTYGGPKYGQIGTLFPWSQEEDLAFIADHTKNGLASALFPLLAVNISAHLTPEGLKQFRATRKAQLGVTIEEIQVADEGRAEKWAALRAYLDDPTVSARAEAVKNGITFRDIVLASTFKWIELGGRSGELEAVLAWDDGKWGKFYAEFERFLEVRN